MFVLVASYQSIVSVEGRRYRPRAYGGPNGDQSWSGFLVFFPMLAPAAAVSTAAETISPTIDGLRRWAFTLSTDHLHDALQRALALEGIADEDIRRAALRAAEEGITLEDVARAEVQAAYDDSVAYTRDAAAQEAQLQAEQLREEAEKAEAAAVRARAHADALTRHTPPRAADAADSGGRRRRAKAKR